MMSMIDSERFFASVPFVLVIPRWWCPFLVPCNDEHILKNILNFGINPQIKAQDNIWAVVKHLHHIRLDSLILKGNKIS